MNTNQIYKSYTITITIVWCNDHNHGQTLLKPSFNWPIILHFNPCESAFASLTWLSVVLLPSSFGCSSWASASLHPIWLCKILMNVSDTSYTPSHLNSYFFGSLGAFFSTLTSCSNFAPLLRHSLQIRPHHQDLLLIFSWGIPFSRPYQGRVLFAARTHSLSLVGRPPTLYLLIIFMRTTCYLYLWFFSVDCFFIANLL